MLVNKIRFSNKQKRTDFIRSIPNINVTKLYRTQLNKYFKRRFNPRARTTKRHRIRISVAREYRGVIFYDYYQVTGFIKPKTAEISFGYVSVMRVVDLKGLKNYSRLNMYDNVEYNYMERNLIGWQFNSDFLMPDFVYGKAIKNPHCFSIANNYVGSFYETAKKQNWFWLARQLKPVSGVSWIKTFDLKSIKSKSDIQKFIETYKKDYTFDLQTYKDYLDMSQSKGNEFSLEYKKIHDEVIDRRQKVDRLRREKNEKIREQISLKWKKLRVVDSIFPVRFRSKNALKNFGRKMNNCVSEKYECKEMFKVKVNKELTACVKYNLKDKKTAQVLGFKNSPIPLKIKTKILNAIDKKYKVVK